MKSTISKLYSISHILFYIITVTLLIFFFREPVPLWSSTLAATDLVRNEIILLDFFSLFMFSNSTTNFLIFGISLAGYILIAQNQKNFLIRVAILFFFIHFFGFYFIINLDESLYDFFANELLFSIFTTILWIILFGVIPGIIIGKIKKYRKKKSPDEVSESKFLTCAKCGREYHSNPKYCVNCLEELLPEASLQ